jgi:hypothetical protein
MHDLPPHRPSNLDDWIELPRIPDFGYYMTQSELTPQETSELRELLRREAEQLPEK